MTQDTGTGKTARKVIDKLIVVGLAVLLVAPFAIYYALQNDAPEICESGEDLKKMSGDETLVVTRALKDEDMTELDRFENLRELELHYSDITDAAIPHIIRHTGLTRLVLHSIALTDAGIAQLRALTGLKKLILIGCLDATAIGLEFLPELPELEHLVLHQLGGVNDAIGPILAKCPKLTIIELENMRGLHDSLCNELSSMSNLRTLTLDLCPNIGDAGVRELTKLTQLERLSLHGLDTMTDASLPEVAKLKNLKLLNLPVRAILSQQAIEKLKLELPGCEFNR